ncbi:MAG TPA: hypothetical protein VMU85_19505 [Stellaceae bacterium]|nr:hypothetical protein [Stellaceae bacterium]
MAPEDGRKPIDGEDADWLDRKAGYIGRGAREIQRELDDLEARIAVLDTFIRNLVRDEKAAAAERTGD